MEGVHRSYEGEKWVRRKPMVQKSEHPPAATALELLRAPLLVLHGERDAVSDAESVPGQDADGGPGRRRTSGDGGFGVRDHILLAGGEGEEGFAAVWPWWRGLAMALSKP
ncbi:hypothetical protein B296_00034523 [Ensete ventricosum]|uniref:Uncharacterized protein n=1 Tax=Ensete ventricosum TaxID=4639 RepID=A0A426YN11_ENSVE|nr:hypothetical protein B296_00034523 [Ensete ventricosum]